MLTIWCRKKHTRHLVHTSQKSVHQIIGKKTVIFQPESEQRGHRSWTTMDIHFDVLASRLVVLF